jgi:hypothetical protein
MADPEILTVEELVKATEKLIELPLMSKTSGQPRKIRVRRIGSREYNALLPPFPPEAEEWGKGEGLTDQQRQEQFVERERAWLRSLPDDKLQQRARVLSDLDYHIAALAAVEPTLTVEQARRLGDDAAELALEVKIFSGLAERKPNPKAEKTSDEPAG